MKFTLSNGARAIAALLFLASVTPLATSSPSESSLDVPSLAAVAEPVAQLVSMSHLQKRQEPGHDHDHDHDHPAPTTTAGAPATGTGALGAATPTAVAPAHNDHEHEHEGHDHNDHEHKHEDDGHEEFEKAHSHGPARVCDDHNHAAEGQYVVWHHIVALVVLIVVASLGCVLPMIMRDSQRTRYFVQCGKYFGAGVVLSVAFVHIMPEALFALTHPCLSKAWTDDYPGYAPLIMMMSGLTMLVIEYLASSLVLKVEAQNKKAVVAATSGDALEANAHAHFGDKHDHVGHSSSASSLENKPQGLQDDCNHAHGLTLLQCGPGVSTKVSTYMLEAGITLHSVFIGISLGVLAGREFLAMTIAICFHQFFEGIALGSRIADLTFRRRLMPILLVAIFALITPVGIAIGMGMRTSYKANSVENLIIMGVCNSIACGVLIYTAYVTLLGGDILYSERFRAESRANKASYLVAVWLGAIVMAVIALWA